MSGELIITLLAAVLAGSGTAIVTGHFSRPQIKAAAAKSDTDGEVAVSGDAREWAKMFKDQADAADARTGKAIEKAEQAVTRAEAAEDRCDELEEQVLAVSAYARVLREQMLRHGWTDVPEPPRNIKPLIDGG